MTRGKRFIVVLLCLCTVVAVFTPSLARTAQPIPFGFCPKYNPRIMYQHYQPFIDYLNQHTSYQFELKLSPVYQDTIARLGRKEIVIASCGPVSYIRAREKYPVRPILRPVSRDGQPHYRGVIIVRQDSPLRKLGDLKGKSFAFGQELSTAGHILPEYYLLKAGVRRKDLKSYSFLRHHDSVVQAVLTGQFEAGAVKDIIAYQYQSKGLRFIHITDPIPTVPIIVHADAPWEVVRSVKGALLKINPNVAIYQEIMATWDEEFKYGFTEAANGDYDAIRKILHAMPLGKGDKGDLGSLWEKIKNLEIDL